jgi:hypothetical protein
MIHMMLSHNLLNTALEKAVEGGDLLGNEAVLLEVLIDDSPRILIFYLALQNLPFGVLHHI